jgi:site-specific DNA-cytosine methylase
VLELFCGIGGCAAALGPSARVVAAIDVHRGALAVYRYNFSHPTRAANLESVPREIFAGFAADLWWLSPPCQPYTVRGLRRDVDDPRARSLRVITRRIAEVRPRHLALENVPGFAESRMREHLIDALERAGYAFAERILCPTELGWPNRRRRYYLAASLEGLAPWPEPWPERRPLGELLDGTVPAALYPDPADLERYARAIHVADPEADPDAVTRCFTSAYGRSWVRSGSYLATDRGLRRFSPREILRLLGFPESYRLPPDLPLERAWPLVGNSLSIPAVRATLGAIPGLTAREATGAP